MKYFVFSFVWRERENGNMIWNNTSLFEGKSIIDLYEHVIKQPEGWCITHVAEITKKEYERAKENGVIG